MTDTSQASQPELWSGGGADDREMAQARDAAEPIDVGMALDDVDDASGQQAAQPQVDHTDDHEANACSGAESGQLVGTQGPERSSQAAVDVTPCANDDTGDERPSRTRGSMLWAAYGDALGFVSELVDKKGLERRTQGASLDHLLDWKRRIGGRWGVDAVLPAGCWSDDTQLRMAVSRSISGHGFDVEIFARIELPVWLSYALGGGRASKAAAKNFGKPRALWYANTFPGWTSAGGNGAAMRIQPHVWVSRGLDDGYMLDVITDSVCTHGHPRAIVGACFHAATLAHCIDTGAAPDGDTCVDIAVGVGGALRLIEEHPILGSTWSGLWEQATGEKFGDHWRRTVDELLAAIHAATECVKTADSFELAYAGVIERLGLTKAEQRGSGILTTVAAAAVATAAPKAHDGMVVTANAVGTDTDTIASMAGALLGACDGAADPPEEPLDTEYLRQEADRLTAISQGRRTLSYPYPDMLTWTAPPTQADAMVSDNGTLAVEGLGQVTQLQAEPMYTTREDFAWEWVRTNFGQTLLIKRRPEVKPRAARNDPAPPAVSVDTSRSRQHQEHDKQPPVARLTRRSERGARTADGAIIEARRKISDDAALGSIVRDIARERSLSGFLDFMRNIREDLRR